MLRHIALASVLALGTTSAVAEDAALVLGVDDYSNLDDLRGGVRVAPAARALEEAGFRTFWREDPSGQGARNLTERFFEDSRDADRLVAVLSGRFATDGRRNWLLSREAEGLNLIDIGDDAVSVEAVLAILGQTPGQAVLIIVTDETDADVRYAPLLKGSFGALDIPQGVTVVITRGSDADQLIRRTLTQPGSDVIEAIAENDRLRLRGFAPRSLVMTRARDVRETIGNSLQSAISSAESQLWRDTQQADTAQAYQLYLERFPQGEFTSDARAALQELRDDPFRQARIREEALNLNRAQRRAVQADLNVLTYNTRGVDGIFGPGTRNAIRNWQQQNGFAQTGFITENQIVRLDGQALRRTTELEVEAERQRRAEEQRDAAFWDETGADGREAGLRAYLRRYPDGLFSQKAAEDLAVIERRKRQQAEAEERAAWDRAVAAGTEQSYRRYLRQYPSGSFRAAAEARIAEAENVAANRAARQEARRVEQALGLEPLVMRVIEARLQQLGLNPGDVDGNFNADTRRALRNFQRDRGLERTGFLDQATASRLLRVGDR